MEQLEVEEANLVGWSDGGITGLCLAANETYNSRIAKLVIWGSNATMSEHDREVYLSMRDVSAWSPRMRASFEAVYGLVDQFFDFLNRGNFQLCFLSEYRFQYFEKLF